MYYDDDKFELAFDYYKSIGFSSLYICGHNDNVDYN
jgi:hypothetical protein